jgi:hypothetical protein
MDAERDAGPPTVGMATETVERGHEERDVRVRTIFMLAAGFVIVAGVIQVVLYFHLEGLWALRRHHLPRPSPVASALPLAPPEPRLQTAPAADLRALRAAEQAELGGYGWVDREAGVVHIPIDRAMELLVRESGRAGGRR